MDFYFGFAIIGSLLLVSSALEDSLVATLLPAKLPVPLRNVATHYDGESDFIYLVGGTNGLNRSSLILRFNIYTETIEEIARLPKVTFQSPLETYFTGNLFYFDGNNLPSEIYKYDIVNKSLNTVGELPVRPLHSASKKNPAGNALLFGGELCRDIMEVNVNSENVQGYIVGQLPVFLTSAAAVKVTNNTALIFGATGGFQYLELDLNTLETKDVAQSSFPAFQYGMTITTDGNFMYIFGGDSAEAGVPMYEIIRLDPNTHAWELLRVGNFPGIPGYYFYQGPEVIWVEKLNRIYLFGGGLRSNDDLIETVDYIYYIDLNPISP